MSDWETRFTWFHGEPVDDFERLLVDAAGAMLIGAAAALESPLASARFLAEGKPRLEVQAVRARAEPATRPAVQVTRGAGPGRSVAVVVLDVAPLDAEQVETLCADLARLEQWRAEAAIAVRDSSTGLYSVALARARLARAVAAQHRDAFALAFLEFTGLEGAADAAVREASRRLAGILDQAVVASERRAEPVVVFTGQSHGAVMAQLGIAASLVRANPVDGHAVTLTGGALYVRAGATGQRDDYWAAGHGLRRESQREGGKLLSRVWGEP